MYEFEPAEYVYETANVYNKKGKILDNRDSLPYVVYSDPEMKTVGLGTYMLDASTNCGDLLDLGTKGVWKVNKVSFLYEYRLGRLIVVKKKLHVKKSSLSYNGDNTQHRLNILQ